MTKLKWQLADAAAFAAASLSSHSLLVKGYFQAYKLFSFKQMDGQFRLYCSSEWI